MSRVVISAVIWAAVIGVPVAFDTWLADTAWAASARHSAVNQADIVRTGFRLVSGVALALMCPFVAYRRRDAFLLLLPYYGLVFSIKICWRVASLPYVDWPLRVERVAE
jgi:hypothetical protein